MLTTHFVFRAVKLLATGALMHTAFMPTAVAQQYTLTYLTSNGSVPASHTDPNLVNTWGLSRSSTLEWWVSANGTGKSTLYDGSGVPQSLVVTVPSISGPTGGTPTGTIYNGSSDFAVGPGAPAIFLFATEDGTISGWNPGVDPLNAVVMVKNAGAVYKGLTAAVMNGKQYLYAPNFATGQVDVWDANFQPVSMATGAFQIHRGRDPLGPFEQSSSASGLVPFNVQNIGGSLFVAFAKQDADKHDEVDGAGLGLVAAFTPAGRLLRVFQPGPFLNAPWGLAMAPSDFGSFSHCLLVGQFGSGQIVAYNIMSGLMEGILADGNNQPLAIDGLWGISFGNGGTAGPFNTLYFGSGPNSEANGTFGSLVPVASSLTQGNDL